LGTLVVLLLVCSGNAFAASENDTLTGIDGAMSLLGITTSQAVGVTYHTHVQNVGWESYWPSNGGTAGTQGQGLRLEGIEIKLTGDLPEGAKVEYRTHVQNQGWETYWSSNGNSSGSQGMSQRLEGIEIRLVNMPDYSIEYRTHIQNLGWETKWAKDGATSGTYGQSLRLEGIQIRIIKENADLTAYNKSLATAKKALKTNYSTYSWDNLQTVIKNNVVTVKSTQEKVDAATEAIETAYAALESVVNAKVYATAGTFGPASGLETISQDVVIKSDRVILQNMHITGNLIISEEVGQGNATLNNITVDGETYVRGGGKNSIHINGGNYKRITIQETASGQVRIVATNANGLDVVITEDAGSEDVILEGGFDKVTVNASKMKVSTRGNTTIRELTVSKAGAGSQFSLDSNSRIERMVFNAKADVKGQGAIGNAQVNADNVTYEKAPEKQNVAKTVKVPPKAPVVKVPVTGITLTGAGNVKTLAKAGTLQITAAVAPANATNNKVTWSIVNGTGTASISNAGVVTGLTAGTVTVNATAQDGSGKIGTLTLTVSEVAAATIATVSTINSSTVNPSFTITLTNDTFTDVASTVSNWTTAMGATGLKVSTITRYSNNQVIIGTTGTAALGTITFKANPAALTKNLASNTLTVTVNPVMVSSIIVTGTGSATTVTKGSTLQMLAVASPANAVNKNLTWSVVNGTGSAAISTTGLLTPGTAGTVTVKATAADGSATVGSATITVLEKTPGVITSATTILNEKVDPTIVVSLTNDTFSGSAGNVNLWVVDVGTTGLKVTGITRNNDTQATITTTGTAKDGKLTIQANVGALTKAVASNSLVITIGKINLTGAVITGNPTVNSTLTATLTPSAATATYQWQRATLATGPYVDISGATAATYKLISDDEGKYIKVIATGTGSYAGVAPSASVLGVNPATLLPTTASFNKASQADVTITLTPNGKTVTGINDGTKDLTLDTDYTVTGDVYTIKKAYLSGKTNGTVTLTFKMSSGTNPTAAIAVSGTVPGDATVSPATASFDKSLLTDVVLTLSLNGRTLTKINDGSKDLEINTDYSVVGNNYTIKKEYLTAKANGTVTLTFTMSGGSSPTAVFSVSESDTTPPTLSGVTTGPVTVGADIAATSNEKGTLYLIPAATAANKIAIEAAGAAANGRSVAATANQTANLSTTGFAAGGYKVYAIDESGNVFNGSAEITVNAP